MSPKLLFVCLCLIALAHASPRKAIAKQQRNPSPAPRVASESRDRGGSTPTPAPTEIHVTTEDDGDMTEVNGRDGVEPEPLGNCPYDLPAPCMPRETCRAPTVGQNDVEHPLTAEMSANDPRTAAFQQQLRIEATNPQDRIVEAARKAHLCSTFAGSCGRTARMIWLWAGMHLRNLPGKRPDAQRIVPLQTDIVRHGTTLTGNNRAKLTAMRRFVSTRDQMNRANQLQPGDWLYIYNGRSGGGQHSVIFIRWDDANPRLAHVVQGAINRLVNPTTMCLKPEGGCRNGWYPITLVLRANEVAGGSGSSPSSGERECTPGSPGCPRSFFLELAGRIQKPQALGVVSRDIFGYHSQRQAAALLEVSAQGHLQLEQEEEHQLRCCQAAASSRSQAGGLAPQASPQLDADGLTAQEELFDTLY